MIITFNHPIVVAMCPLFLGFTQPCWLGSSTSLDIWLPAAGNHLSVDVGSLGVLVVDKNLRLAL